MPPTDPTPSGTPITESGDPAALCIGDAGGDAAPPPPPPPAVSGGLTPQQQRLASTAVLGAVADSDDEEPAGIFDDNDDDEEDGPAPRHGTPEGLPLGDVDLEEVVRVLDAGRARASAAEGGFAGGASMASLGGPDVATPMRMDL